AHGLAPTTKPRPAAAPRKRLRSMQATYKNESTHHDSTEAWWKAVSAKALSLYNKCRRNTMHLHILGICGTFMGGLALIARSAGHTVTGCDTGVYPPMSTQLEEQGIELIE